MKHRSAAARYTTIPQGSDIPAIALTLRTKRTGAIGAVTSHASVSASPQFFCSSEGTVVLIHGFAPPGLASNHRGWGIHTHSILPGGRRASLRPFPFADRHTETAFGRSFCWAGAGQTKLSVSRQKIPGTILDRTDWIISAWRCRARGTPGEEPAPLRRGFCQAAPGATTPGAVSLWNRWRMRPQLGCEASYSHQSQGNCCSKSSVRLRFSERREILLTVRGDTSFCSTRGRQGRLR
jgi:hypothetical protein